MDSSKYLYKNEQVMKININHPGFISFLETINKNVLSNIKVEKYFSLSSDKKSAIQYLVLKLVNKSVKLKSNMSDEELREFINVLQKKNVELENYEFAEVLKDIVLNFDNINEMTKSTPIKQKRTIKTDKTTDAE